MLLFCCWEMIVSKEARENMPVCLHAKTQSNLEPRKKTQFEVSSEEVSLSKSNSCILKNGNLKISKQTLSNLHVCSTKKEEEPNSFHARQECT